MNSAPKPDRIVEPALAPADVPDEKTRDEEIELVLSVKMRTFEKASPGQG